MDSPKITWNSCKYSDQIQNICKYSTKRIYNIAKFRLCFRSLSISLVGVLLLIDHMLVGGLSAIEFITDRFFYIFNFLECCYTPNYYP